MKTGGRAVASVTDIGVEAQLVEMVATAVRTFGRLDILYNNAVDAKTSNAASEVGFLNFDGELCLKLIRTNV